jgi:selenocysteine-specific elongation factor
MIVATAGHVDHGKTTLVGALTGIDTDRLAEEKRRGMSIDLGFAHADLGDGVAVSFVDVPGHERFVRNMAAGVAAVDLALLVVAADDGPMPQTHEHVAILEWLGVPHCLVALTKVDRVERSQADATRIAIAALLASTRYAGAPIVAVAAPGGSGLDDLRTALRRSASKRDTSTRSRGRFRLAIDRHFTLAGAGTVVTGSVGAGSCAVGDALVVSPHGTAVRVRGIEVHGRAQEAVRAGERCALNLAGAELKHGAIARGDWVVDPAAHAPTDRRDVRLGAGRDLERPLRDGARLQLHLGAATVGARIALLDRRALEAGSAALAQLVLDRPIGALHGDLFIVRDAAHHRLAGGGTVIDPFGRPRGRARPERLAELDALALPVAAEALSGLVTQSPAPIDLDRFAQARNLDARATDELLRSTPELTVIRGGRMVDAATAPVTDTSAPIWGVATPRWHALRDALAAQLDMLHAAEPDRVGATDTELAQQRRADPLQPLVPAALAALLADGAIVRDGFCLRRPGHRARLSDADQALLDRLGAQLRAAGLRPPIVGELAATLGTPLPALLGDLVSLARRGHLVQVAKNRYFLPATVHALGAIAATLAHEAGAAGFDAAAFRDRSGIGRNLTIEVLEHLDRTGVTRFRDGRRRLAEAARVVT